MWLSVVPVFPAWARYSDEFEMATFAFVPVQHECTFVSRYWVSCHVAPSGTTRWPLFFDGDVTIGFWLYGTTFVNASSGRRMPCAAIVE